MYIEDGVGIQEENKKKKSFNTDYLLTRGPLPGATLFWINGTPAVKLGRSGFSADPFAYENVLVVLDDRDGICGPRTHRFPGRALMQSLSAANFILAAVYRPHRGPRLGGRRHRAAHKAAVDLMMRMSGLKVFIRTESDRVRWLSEEVRRHSDYPRMLSFLDNGGVATVVSGMPA